MKNSYGYKINIAAGSKKEIIKCVEREIYQNENNLEWQKKQMDEAIKRVKDLQKRIPKIKKLLLELKEEK